MFFTDWESLIRIVIVGISAYVGIIFLLRLFGKRTLSKMNAFDFIITVAMGSVLSAVILNKDLVLVEGLTAFFLLVFMQYVMSWLSIRSKTVRDLIKAEPVLLFHRGHFLHQAMKQQRVTEGEIKAAVRAENAAGLSEVLAVVMETEGTLSVVKKNGEGDLSALTDVQRFDGDQEQSSDG
jgi:uncharacterized membrane protein YcaP (DUF421 family)